MEALNFIGLVIAVWLIAAGAAPIQWVKKVLDIHPETKSENLWTRFFMKLFNCMLCLSFWAGLLYYWPNWEMACVTSFAGLLFEKAVDKFL
jgi:hypothetical protein